MPPSELIPRAYQRASPQPTQLRKALLRPGRPNHANSARINARLRDQYGEAYARRFGRDLEITVESKGYLALELLFDACPGEEFDEMCRGGQIRLPFDEALFERLKGMNAEPRISSHYANSVIPTAFQQVPGEQFGIDGDFLPTLLFGKLIDRTGSVMIYIQAERNSFNPSASLVEKFWHAMDATTYAWTLRNQGPYGCSARTDANPMGGTENPPPPWMATLHPRLLQGAALKAAYVAQYAADRSLSALSQILGVNINFISIHRLGDAAASEAGSGGSSTAVTAGEKCLADEPIPGQTAAADTQPGGSVAFRKFNPPFASRPPAQLRHARVAYGLHEAARTSAALPTPVSSASAMTPFLHRTNTGSGPSANGPSTAGERLPATASRAPMVRTGSLTGCSKPAPAAVIPRTAQLPPIDGQERQARANRMGREVLDAIPVGRLAGEFNPSLFDVVHSVAYEKNPKYDSLPGKLTAGYVLARIRGKHSVAPAQKRDAWSMAPPSFECRTYGQAQIAKVQSYGASFVGVPIPGLLTTTGEKQVLGKTLFRSASQMDQDLLQLCSEMKKMLRQETGKSADPMVGARIAAYFKQNFIAIHPYMDGNGRVSRLVAERILREFNIPRPDWSTNEYPLALSIEEAARRMLAS